jgi:hypothetical protein
MAVKFFALERLGTGQLILALLEPPPGGAPDPIEKLASDRASA